MKFFLKFFMMAHAFLGLSVQNIFAQEALKESSDTFLPRYYGFRIDSPGIVCDPSAPRGPESGKQFYTVCEAGIKTSNYVGVLWRDRTAQLGTQIPKAVGGGIMKLLGETKDRPLSCTADKEWNQTINDIKGSFADCILSPIENSQKPIHLTLFFFTPNPKMPSVVIAFSDFGKEGVNTKANSREFLKKINK